MFVGHKNLVATDLLGKPPKGFIVNLADLPRKRVNKLATSDERVNHGSQVNMYRLSRILKSIITVVLTIKSDPKN